MERQIKDEIDRYLADVQQAIYEPTLVRELSNIPLVSKEEAFFILLPFLNSVEKTEEVYQAAVALGAVFSALHAHSQVDLHNSSSTEQQLTVLAGDHYSGIHYRILATLQSFPFIRALSEAIAHSNEEKTELFFHLPQTVEEWEKSMLTSDVALITTYYDVFEFQRYIEYAESILPYIYATERLRNEQISSDLRERLREHLKLKVEKTITLNEASLNESLLQVIKKRLMK